MRPDCGFRGSLRRDLSKEHHKCIRPVGHPGRCETCCLCHGRGRRLLQLENDPAPRLIDCEDCTRRQKGQSALILDEALLDEALTAADDTRWKQLMIFAEGGPLRNDL